MTNMTNKGRGIFAEKEGAGEEKQVKMLVM
jgi:hypothetical protein